MNATLCRGEQAIHRDLAHVLEPLVGYICAADRPKETLRCVLVVLRREVQKINGAAWKHVSEHCARSLAVLCSRRVLAPPDRVAAVRPQRPIPIFTTKGTGHESAARFVH